MATSRGPSPLRMVCSNLSHVHSACLVQQVDAVLESLRYAWPTAKPKKCADEGTVSEVPLGRWAGVSTDG